MKKGDKVKVINPDFENAKIQLSSIGVVTRVSWDRWLKVLFDGVQFNMTPMDVELIGEDK